MKEIWQEWGSKQVAFDGFVSHLSWKACDSATLRPNNATVEKLCHATHRRNAISGQNYIFKSYQRKGKCRDVEDGRPVCHEMSSPRL